MDTLSLTPPPPFVAPMDREGASPRYFFPKLYQDQIAVTPQNTGNEPKYLSAIENSPTRRKRTKKINELYYKGFDTLVVTV